MASWPIAVLLVLSPVSEAFSAPDAAVIQALCRDPRSDPQAAEKVSAYVAANHPDLSVPEWAPCAQLLGGGAFAAAPRRAANVSAPAGGLTPADAGCLLDHSRNCSAGGGVPGGASVASAGGARPSVINAVSTRLTPDGIAVAAPEGSPAPPAAGAAPRPWAEAARAAWSQAVSVVPAVAASGPAARVAGAYDAVYDELQGLIQAPQTAAAQWQKAKTDWEKAEGQRAWLGASAPEIEPRRQRAKILVDMLAYLSAQGVDPSRYGAAVRQKLLSGERDAPLTLQALFRQNSLAQLLQQKLGDLASLSPAEAAARLLALYENGSTGALFEGSPLASIMQRWKQVAHGQAPAGAPNAAELGREALDEARFLAAASGMDEGGGQQRALTFLRLHELNSAIHAYVWTHPGVLDADAWRRFQDGFRADLPAAGSIDQAALDREQALTKLAQALLARLAQKGDALSAAESRASEAVIDALGRLGPAEIAALQSRGSADVANLLERQGKEPLLAWVLGQTEAGAFGTEDGVALEKAAAQDFYGSGYETALAKAKAGGQEAARLDALLRATSEITRWQMDELAKAAAALRDQPSFAQLMTLLGAQARAQAAVLDDQRRGQSPADAWLVSRWSAAKAQAQFAISFRSADDEVNKSMDGFSVAGFLLGRPDAETVARRVAYRPAGPADRSYGAVSVGGVRLPPPYAGSKDGHDGLSYVLAGGAGRDFVSLDRRYSESVRPAASGAYDRSLGRVQVVSVRDGGASYTLTEAVQDGRVSLLRYERQTAGGGLAVVDYQAGTLTEYEKGASGFEPAAVYSLDKTRSKAADDRERTVFSGGKAVYSISVQGGQARLQDLRDPSIAKVYAVSGAPASAKELGRIVAGRNPVAVTVRIDPRAFAGSQARGQEIDRVSGELLKMGMIERGDKADALMRYFDGARGGSNVSFDFAYDPAAKGPKSSIVVNQLVYGRDGKARVESRRFAYVADLPKQAGWLGRQSQSLLGFGDGGDRVLKDIQEHSGMSGGYVEFGSGGEPSGYVDGRGYHSVALGSKKGENDGRWYWAADITRDVSIDGQVVDRMPMGETFSVWRAGSWAAEKSDALIMSTQWARNNPMTAAVVTGVTDGVLSLGDAKTLLPMMLMGGAGEAEKLLANVSSKVLTTVRTTIQVARQTAQIVFDAQMAVGKAQAMVYIPMGLIERDPALLRQGVAGGTSFLAMDLAFHGLNKLGLPGFEAPEGREKGKVQESPRPPPEPGRERETASPEREPRIPAHGQPPLRLGAGSPVTAEHEAPPVSGSEQVSRSPASERGAPIAGQAAEEREAVRPAEERSAAPAADAALNFAVADRSSLEQGMMPQDDLAAPKAANSKFFGLGRGEAAKPAAKAGEAREAAVSAGAGEAAPAAAPGDRTAAVPNVEPPVSPEAPPDAAPSGELPASSQGIRAAREAADETRFAAQRAGEQEKIVQSDSEKAQSREKQVWQDWMAADDQAKQARQEAQQARDEGGSPFQVKRAEARARRLEAAAEKRAGVAEAAQTRAKDLAQRAEEAAVAAASARKRAADAQLLFEQEFDQARGRPAPRRRAQGAFRDWLARADARLAAKEEKLADRPAVRLAAKAGGWLAGLGAGPLTPRNVARLAGWTSKTAGRLLQGAGGALDSLSASLRRLIGRPRTGPAAPGVFARLLDRVGLALQGRFAAETAAAPRKAGFAAGLDDLSHGDAAYREYRAEAKRQKSENAEPRIAAVLADVNAAAQREIELGERPSTRVLGSFVNERTRLQKANDCAIQSWYNNPALRAVGEAVDYETFRELFERSAGKRLRKEGTDIDDERKFLGQLGYQLIQVDKPSELEILRRLQAAAGGVNLSFDVRLPIWKAASPSSHEVLIQGAYLKDGAWHFVVIDSNFAAPQVYTYDQLLGFDDFSLTYAQKSGAGTPDEIGENEIARRAQRLRDAMASGAPVPSAQELDRLEGLGRRSFDGRPLDERQMKAVLELRDRPDLACRGKECTDAQIRAKLDGLMKAGLSAQAAYRLLNDGWLDASARRKGLSVIEAEKPMAQAAPLLKPGEVIADSNVAIALRRRANGEPLSLGDAALLSVIEARQASGALSSRFRLTETSIQESALKGKPSLDRGPAVALSVSRDSPEYKSVLKILDGGAGYDGKPVFVGGGKGVNDRTIAADAFFAKTESGLPAAFATADAKVYKGLARLGGLESDGRRIDFSRLGSRPFRQVYARGFLVRLNGREIFVIPLGE